MSAEAVLQEKIDDLKSMLEAVESPMLDERGKHLGHRAGVAVVRSRQDTLVAGITAVLDSLSPVLEKDTDPLTRQPRRVQLTSTMRKDLQEMLHILKISPEGGAHLYGKLKLQYLPDELATPEEVRGKKDENAANVTDGEVVRNVRHAIRDLLKQEAVGRELLRRLETDEGLQTLLEKVPENVMSTETSPSGAL